MFAFYYAPSVPLSYERLSALRPEETAEALRLGYVAETVDPSGPVSNDKALNVPLPEIGPGPEDWRNRMFLVWFCYLFENLDVIRSPLGAVVELHEEFECGPRDFDVDAGMPYLGSLYAGVETGEALSRTELASHRFFLKPYYENAVRLLETWHPE